MASKRRLISLIFIINCITKCSLINMLLLLLFISFFLYISFKYFQHIFDYSKVALEHTALVQRTVPPATDSVHVIKTCSWLYNPWLSLIQFILHSTESHKVQYTSSSDLL